jgi:hypothetical protein
VGQEEAFHGAVKDHDLDVRIHLQGGHDFVQLRNGLGAEDVQWRVVEGDPPVGGRTALDPDLLVDGDIGHVQLLVLPPPGSTASCWVGEGGTTGSLTTRSARFETLQE